MSCKNNVCSKQFLQKHAILLDAAALGAMPEPFSLPFPEMLYMQAKIANLSVSTFLCLFPSTNNN